MTQELIANEIVAYAPFKQELVAIEKANATLVFDLEDKKGNAAARSHVHKLRQSKAAVEKVRVAQKAESLETGRQIDSQAREIKEKFDSMIEVHAAPIKDLEERESKRIEEIQDRLKMFVTQQDVYGLPSDRIQMRLESVKRMDLDEAFFAEFLADAGVAKDQALTSLNASLTAALNSEEEAAELDRLRKESAEREQKDRDAKIALEAAEKAEAVAKAKAAQVKFDADVAAQKIKDDAELRELELKLEAEKAKREAAEAIQKAKDDAAATAKREQDADDKRAANKKHRAKIIKAAVSDMVKEGATTAIAEKCIGLIAEGKIPNVTINF